MPLETTIVSAKDHLVRFKAKIIAHPQLIRAKDQLDQLIEEPAGASLAALIGPTGAGKSTLLNRVHKSVLERLEADMTANTSLMPIVCVEAPAPEQGSFSWKDFYLRILVEIKDQACEWHLALKERDLGKPGVARLASLTLAELRRRVEAGFHHRGVKVLLIDEAQHFHKMASGRRLHDQMDVLKSLASLSKAFVVLFGTYELINLLELNGQLARRCVMVHLPRYRYDEPTQRQEFQTAIRSLEQQIILPTPPDLVPHSKFFYKNSAGCVGILKNWLTSGYSRTLKAGGASLTMATLQASMLPPSSLLKIAEEIGIGEAHWLRSQTTDIRLDELLGMDIAGKGATPFYPAVAAVARPPVGIRNPTRDPVGLEAAMA